MAHILADVHIAEGTLSINSATCPSDEQSGYYKGVLDKYGLSKDNFDSAVAYYSSNPDEYQRIHDKLIEILTAKELEVHSLKEDSSKFISKIVPIGRDDLWKGERIRKVSSDSLKLNSSFDFHVDSLVIGEIWLTVKYRRNPSVFNTPNIKNCLGVEYNDGVKDSIVTNIDFINGASDKSVVLKLKGKRLKRIYGELVIIPSKTKLTIDATDISLKVKQPTRKSVIK